MKIDVTKHHIINALKMVMPATNARATLPVLTFVNLSAENGLLTIAATNLEISIQANTPAFVE